MDMATTMKDTKTSESTEATKTARLAKVTVLGTGIMGGGIAKTLAAAGFAVTAWNRTPAHAEPLREYGVKVESELADALAEADVILVVVYDAASVLDVLGRGIGAASPMQSGCRWRRSASKGRIMSRSLPSSRARIWSKR
jgi:3-hydroxyisobutyrate dehydrogenase